jgi:uncharacterized protein YgiM (DUF1202 family)
MMIGGGLALAFVTPVGVSKVRTALAADSGFAFGSGVRVATDALNLRFDPGLSADVVTVLYTGAVGTIESDPVSMDGYEWQQAKFGAVDGWVAIEYLESYDLGSPFATGDSVVVATDNLRLRNGAGLSYDVLALLQNGDGAVVVGGPITADGYVWYQINLDAGGGGWVAGEYLQANTGTPGGIRIRVYDGPLNVRSNPSLSGTILGSIPTGGTARILQADYGTDADGYHWIYVMSEADSSLKGFVAAVYTEPVS